MIRKNCFGDQNLQFVAFLHQKLKFLIFIFFTLIILYFQNKFHCNISLAYVFPTMQNLLKSSKCSKSYTCPKN